MALCPPRGQCASRCDAAPLLSSKGIERARRDAVRPGADTEPPLAIDTCPVSTGPSGDSPAERGPPRPRRRTSPGPRPPAPARRGFSCCAAVPRAYGLGFWRPRARAWDAGVEGPLESSETDRESLRVRVLSSDGTGRLPRTGARSTPEAKEGRGREDRQRQGPLLSGRFCGTPTAGARDCPMPMRSRLPRTVARSCRCCRGARSWEPSE